MLSVAEIWDRLWWSMMITILVGLAWLKFVDPILTGGWIYVGMMLALAVGAAYFIKGIVSLVRERRLEKQLEAQAYTEMLQQLGAEVRHD